MLDVDVRGALAVKALYGAQALTIFIQPPSIEALGDRLRARGTESEDRIAVRLDRARMEMDTAPAFDAVVVNDDLDAAVAETVRLAVAFLGA
jgi:guanylate kinase